MNSFKHACYKLGLALEWLVGIAFGICLFAGGLGFIGFIIAFCMGGDSANEICTWLYETYYVWLIKIGTVSTILSFLIIYLKGDANWVNPFKKQKMNK